MADRASAVLRAALDAREAEIGVDEARAFSPDVAVAAGATLPALEYTVGVQLSFSGSDIDSSARERARQVLTQTRSALTNARSLAVLDARRGVLKLRLALKDLDAATEDLADSRVRLEGTHCRAGSGQATDLELAEADLDVLVAEHAVTAAQVELARKWFLIEHGQY